jgi:peptide deformylase
MDVSAGTARPVIRYGAGVLHRPCAVVDSFGASLEALVEDMFASMYAAGGVGLTANQVGVGLRVFVYDCPDATGERQAGHVINPVLTASGALAPSVTVTGTGLLARCLQHETDHLRGIVYVDLLPADERAVILAAAGLPSGRRPRPSGGGSRAGCRAGRGPR